MATITSTTTGNWLTGATWVGGVAPTTGDNAVIASGHTVTVDGNVTVGNDTATAAITINGTLKFSRTTSHVLTLRGTVANGVGGVWDRGTIADPILEPVVSGVIFNSSATPANNKYPISIGETNRIGGFHEVGSDKDYKAEPSSNWSAGQTVLPVTTTTGWIVGDVIAVTSTNVYSTAEREFRTILAINPGVSVTVSALTYAHTTDAHVMNLTRNVYWETADANYYCYLMVSIRTGMSADVINIKNVAYYGVNANFNDRSGFTISGATNNIYYLDVDSPFGVIQGQSMLTGTRRNGTDQTAAGSSAYGLRNLSTQPVIDDLNIFNRNGSSVNNGVWMTQGGSGIFNRATVVGTSFALVSSWSQGGMGCVFNDCSLVNANSWACSLSPAISLSLIGGEIDACPVLFSLNSGAVSLKNVAIGQGVGFSGSSYLFGTNAGAAMTVDMTDCLFPATAVPIVLPSNMSTTLPSSRLSIINKNTDPTLQDIWKNTGSIHRDNTVLMDSKSTINFKPYIANTLHGETIPVLASAGIPVTFKFYLRYDATYGTATPPSITVSGLGITPQTFTAGASANTTYSQEIIVTPVTTGNLSVTISGKSTSTTGNYWASGLPYPPLINYIDQYGYTYNPTSPARTADSVITEATEATVAAYTGISISGGTITLTSNHSIQEIYDYCQYYRVTNLIDPFFTSSDGVNFTSTYAITMTGANLTGSGVINMPTKTLTMTGGATTSLSIYALNGNTGNLAVSGLSAHSVLLQDNSGTQLDYQPSVTGTFSYFTPVGSTGTWKVTIKKAGYEHQIITFTPATGGEFNYEANTPQKITADGLAMYSGATSALCAVSFTGTTQGNIDIGDGVVTLQAGFDETEVALATNAGLLWLAAGGDDCAIFNSSSGDYLFMTDGWRLRRATAPDVNATFQAFVISTEGIIVDGVNGGVLFLTSDTATAIADAIRPDLVIINEGVQKASLLVPHDTDL